MTFKGEHRIKSLQCDCKDLQSKIGQFKEYDINYDKRLAENRNLKRIIVDSEISIKDSKSEIKYLQLELGQLKDICDSNIAKFDCLKKENDSLKYKLEESDWEMENLYQDCNESQESIIQLKTELEKQVLKNDHLERENFSLKGKDKYFSLFSTIHT